MNCKLEICVDSIESALNAQSAGAARVEYCDNLIEGGTTPSYGSIVSARNNLNIGLHVIIRPRGGDFLYSGTEYDIMRRDIEICGESGVDGIVAGILLPGGSIDVDRTARLFELARPMTATFHRAFDLCNDPTQGIEDVISTGAARLLTSGLKNSARDGIEMIRRLVVLAAERIIIMPGGGIDETNAAMIVSATKVNEIHLTARSQVESDMIFRRQGINMGMKGFPEFSRKVADPEKIKNIAAILKMI